MSKKEQNQRHYEANKERIASKQQEWRENNPERWAYLTQKQHAKRRGIEFLFSFEEWVEWWGDDFERRGCGPDDLQMARNDDVGPYHPDNVYKSTTADNASLGNITRKRA